MRHHADFRVTELRVVLDPVYERRAAWSRGEQPLEDDERGPVFQDRLQCLDWLRIREDHQLTVVRQAFSQRRHEVGRSNHHRCRRHALSLPK